MNRQNDMIRWGNNLDSPSESRTRVSGVRGRRHHFPACLKTPIIQQFKEHTKKSVCTTVCIFNRLLRFCTEKVHMAVHTNKLVMPTLPVRATRAGGLEKGDK